MSKNVIFNDYKINIKKTVAVLLLVMVISAIIGFIYEEIFYLIDLGYLVKRGSTFGPWIPIYAFGGLFIVLLTYRLKKRPFLVFLTNCVVTGSLEYTTALVLDKVFHTRLWDYNVEIWNYGNINGYICLRSVLLFGTSSLLLIYFIVPKLLKLSDKVSSKWFCIISYILGFVFFLDVLLYAIVH
jgi:uncharacterized membrane protein